VTKKKLPVTFCFKKGNRGLPQSGPPLLLRLIVEKKPRRSRDAGLHQEKEKKRSLHRPGEHGKKKKKGRGKSVLKRRKRSRRRVHKGWLKKTSPNSSQEKKKKAPPPQLTIDKKKEDMRGLRREKGKGEVRTSTRQLRPRASITTTKGGRLPGGKKGGRDH